MSWDIRDDGKTEKTYFIEDETLKETLVFELDRKNNEIRYYPKDGKFFLKEILLSGFDEIPDDIFTSGSIKGGLLYFLNDRFEGKGFNYFEVSAKGNSEIVGKGKNKKIIMSYESLLKLTKSISSIYYEARIERGEEVDSVLHGIYPKNFDKTDADKADRNKARRLLKSLDTSTIPHLKNPEAQKAVDYFVKLIEQRSGHQSFLNLTKLKIDEVSIDTIIEKLNNYIQTNATEQNWSKLLIENLFIVDSKYIYGIPEINLTLGGIRKVDFGLIDSDGYLDIFEIKRPNTKLFDVDTDRGNYYWHKDTVKAIVQAEKYLHSAERKANSLVEDLKREKHVEIPFKIIKPRLFLVIGQSSQLVNNNMIEDFKILRRSLKNVEIILYDEFVKRLENQKGKVFLTSKEGEK